MTIYTVFGEMGSLIPADAQTKERTSLASDNVDNYDDDYSRCAMVATGSPSYAETADIGSGLVNAWIKFRMKVRDSDAGGDKQRFVWYDDLGLPRIRLTWNTAGLLAKLWYYLGSDPTPTWTQAGASFAIDLPAAGQFFSIYVLCNDAAGTIQLFTSSTERINISLDTTAIDQLNKARLYGTQFAGGTETGETRFSEGIISDEPMLTDRLMTWEITGAGTTNTFDSGTSAEVDETVYSDADKLASATAGQRATFAGSLIGSLTGQRVRAFGVAFRANKGGSGPTQAKAIIRVAGTDYAGADIALGLGMGAHVTIWEDNPTAGADWGTDVPDEIGVESVA